MKTNPIVNIPMNIMTILKTGIRPEDEPENFIPQLPINKNISPGEYS